jgi:glycosyltransferase involved in cell wall biosynthesis
VSDIPPKVSVCLITYQHVRFIAQAVESVLAQRTNFPFELVIGEDESTDGTREIVQRYAEQHPDRIRLHLHSRANNIAYGNRATGRHNFVHNLRSARGEFIALLDGDDYFTDPEKLQRQVDYLETHPECSVCFHRVRTVDQNGEPLAAAEQELPKPRFTLDDLLARDFAPPTASVMFRRGLFGEFPEWYFRCPVGDFPLHVLNGIHGDFGFIDREMAAYRVHAGAMWSAQLDYATSAEERKRGYERKVTQLDGVIHLYEMLCDIGLAPRQVGILRENIAFHHLLAARLLCGNEQWSALRQRLRQLLRARPWPERVRWREVGLLLLKAHAPVLVRKG